VVDELIMKFCVELIVFGQATAMTHSIVNAFNVVLQCLFRTK
jgi:hypothetical protein